VSKSICHSSDKAKYSINQSKSAKRLAIMAVIAIGLSVATAKGVLVCFTVTVALNAVIAWG
jgi:hypothetical protein